MFVNYKIQIKHCKNCKKKLNSNCNECFKYCIYLKGIIYPSPVTGKISQCNGKLKMDLNYISQMKCKIDNNLINKLLNF